MQIFGYPLRPESLGSVSAALRGPQELPLIRANHLATESDRRVASTVPLSAALGGAATLAPFVGEETTAGR